MDYISTAEAAQKWNLTPARVRAFAREGRIKGVRLMGKSWLIPADATKPIDGRTRESKAGQGQKSTSSFPLFLYRQSSHDDVTQKLTQEEAQLLEAQELLVQCQFDQARAQYENLLGQASTTLIKAAALHGLSLCCLAQGDSYWFFLYANKLQVLSEQPGQYQPVVQAIAAELESYYRGNESFVSFDPAGYNSDDLGGMWPFLAAQSSYAATIDCLTGGGPTSTLPYELICHNLEEKGMLYPALLVHLNLAVICYFAKAYDNAQAHLSRVMQISYQRNYLFPIAVNASYLDKHLDDVLAKYPADFAKKILSYSKQIHAGYQAIVKTAGESHLFSSITHADFEYTIYAINGLTNKEIASLKGLSVVTVSKHYSSICQKLSVGSKKELAAVAAKALSNYDISV